MLLVAFEAVSPICESRQNWEVDIDSFWAAYDNVFEIPQTSELPGFHIHVSPGPSHVSGSGAYTLNECKAIAFGCVVFDHFVYQMLPLTRRENGYCTANTLQSRFLKNQSIKSIIQQLENVQSKNHLITIMQGDNPKTQRYVLWNFVNIAPKTGEALGTESGTIEFRGGRGMRGEVRTKRWIAFAIAFIDLCLTKVCQCRQSYCGLCRILMSLGRRQFLARPKTLGILPGSKTRQEARFVTSKYNLSIDGFYTLLRTHAEKFEVAAYLPTSWHVMNESHKYGSPLEKVFQEEARLKKCCREFQAPSYYGSKKMNVELVPKDEDENFDFFADSDGGISGKNDNELRCRMCGLSFQSRKKLFSHLDSRGHHLDAEFSEDDSSEYDEDWLRCRMCGRTFLSRNELFSHLDRRGHYVDTDDSEFDDYDYDADWLRCRKCGRTFDSRNELFSHLDRRGHYRDTAYYY